MNSEIRDTQVIYCLSGLGADSRVFDKLELPGISLVHLEWLIPIGKEESLHDYAVRLSQSIKHENPVIFGLSFGGMMAIEISRLINVKAVILISSIKSATELPVWMKLLGKCKAYKILPNRKLASIPGMNLFRPVQNFFLGATAPEEIAIANEFRDSVNPLYLKWSLGQILRWKNDFQPPMVFHLHGDKDKIFPITRLKASHVIRNGGHFMVMSHASEISPIICGIVEEIQSRRTA
ncbi:MAG: alpha/beta hydrolase [Flavitalea sp.]